jgi:hypothetical protein
MEAYMIEMLDAAEGVIAFRISAGLESALLP